MIRTQVQLTDSQAEALRRASAEQGVSVAALIREAVDRAMVEGDAAVRRRRALAVVGRFSSGHTDVSEEHDHHLADAFSA